MNVKIIIEIASDVTIKEINNMFKIILTTYKHNIRKMDTVIEK